MRSGVLVLLALAGCAAPVDHEVHAFNAGQEPARVLFEARFEGGASVTEDLTLGPREARFVFDAFDGRADLTFVVRSGELAQSAEYGTDEPPPRYLVACIGEREITIVASRDLDVLGRLQRGDFEAGRAPPCLG